MSIDPLLFRSQFSAADSDVLDAVVRDAEKLAAERDLELVPARADRKFVVSLDEALDLRRVIDLAARAESKFLYLNRLLATEIGSIWPIQRGVPNSEAQQLHQAWSRIEGWTAQITLGFAHAGVVHVWTTRAAWADELEMLVAAARTALLDDEPDSPKPDRPSEERIEELAAELAAMPEFRRATRFTDKVKTARAIPALGELYGQRAAGWQVRWDVEKAVTVASDLVEREREDHLERLQALQGDLAVALATNASFQAVSTKRAREKFAAEWISANHTDGLRLKAWWTDELATRAKDQLSPRVL